MSIAEANPAMPVLLSEVETQQTILATYNYPNTHLRVEFVSPHDLRYDRAHDIEVAMMHELGDPEDEVRKEMAAHRWDSMIFLAFREGSEATAEDIIGMGRIIPYSEQLGDKTLEDLASISIWAGADKPSHLPEVARAKQTHNVADITAAFMAESGCQDMNKVWDIATFAPRLDLSYADMSRVQDAVVASFTQEGIKAYREGRLTHITAFNENEVAKAHESFLHLGYPFHKLFDLEPMLYDSFGTGVGMKAQPAWMRLEDLDRDVFRKVTRHMGVIATQPAMAEFAVIE